IVALQLSLSAGLLRVNFIIEDIPGRRIDQALHAIAPNADYAYLPDSAFQTVQLPRGVCCSTALLIYRTTLTGREAALRDPAVLIVSAQDNAHVYIDGHFVGDFGRSIGQPANMARRPQLVRLPAALVHEGARIDIAVQRAVGFGHLRPFHVGDYDALFNSFVALRFLRSDMPFATGIIGAFVAIFCLCAAPLFGARGLLFALAGLAASWSAQQVALLLSAPPWPTTVSYGIYFTAFLGASVCALWFFVEWTSVFEQRRAPRHPVFALALDPWGTAARRQLAIGAVSVIAAGGIFIFWRLHSPAPLHPMVMAQDIDRVLGWVGLLAMAFSLVRVLAYYLRGSARDPIEGSAFIFVIVAAVADIAMVRFFYTYGVFLDVAVAFFPLALLLSLAVRARSVFEAATANTEKLNRLVNEREQVIRTAMEEIRRNEHAAMLLEERSRIMRDMHDGIGGQLLGLILQARSHKVPSETLVTGLEQSLDDLRLVVDSLEQGEGSLSSALGAFRARIEPRCDAAGVELLWEVEDVGVTPDIGPDKTLQVYRILLEACTNALKHSGAKRVAVSLSRNEFGNVEIALTDDGRGFDVNTQASGRGRANMRARAERIGADLTIESSAAGTRIRLQLPD
ncbi:MAG: hypothetical protein K2X34_01620, partial [Hyphomonadaceae bacterium]|nr:hypothetical protein [Hyphomonadaceae bacterium]